MKYLILLFIASLGSHAQAFSDIKGKCSSFKESKYSLEFDLLQTDFRTQVYSFQGSRKTLIGRKQFQINSKFMGIYQDQFYSFSFNVSFIKDASNLLIKKEEYRKKGASSDEAYVVNSHGYILDSLLCQDLNQ